jgi:AsmA protein
MSRLIAILAGLLILIVAIIVAVPFLIPMETYKNQVVSIVKEQTGRDLRIDGDIGLSFFPNIAVSIKDVGFSNAAWAKEKEMASMKEMRAALKLRPLFSGNVEIDSFVLVDPVIHLEVRRDGTPNWQFETARAQAAAPAQPAAGESGGAGVSGFSLGEVSIRNGRASYANAQSGAAFAASEVNVDLSLPGLDQPFRADGSLVWNGDRIAMDLKADRPRALTEGGETPVVLAVATPKLKADYAGTLKVLGGLAFQGDVKLDVTSVRELAAWAGSPMPAGDGFGPLALTGKAGGSGTAYRFTDAKIAFDGMNATGNLTLDTGGARPNLKGNLDADRIDVNTYLGKSAGGGGAGGGSGGGDEGWSTAPIDLSGLKALDMDFDFSTKEILFQQIKIADSALKLKLSNGVLNANLSKLNLYQGAGAGTLTVNGAGATPQIAANFKLAGLAAEPFLTDAADFKRLQGMTALDIAVTAAGRSQRDMVSALNGNGSIKFTDGKIKGINIAQLARNVFSAAATGWQSGGAQDTDFSEMGGTFTITNGVLKNDDLRLLSPLIRVSGAGTVNMPPKTLNYRVEPKLVASLEGQGATGTAQGIEVPILITGSWSNPRFAPDLASMIQNRENIESTIKSIREDGGKGLIRGLMGQPAESGAAAGTGTGTETGSGTAGESATGGEAAPAETPPAETQPRPEDALRQIFGR